MPMANAEGTRKKMSLLALSVLLALLFLLAGGSKLIAPEMHFKDFQEWGYPIWFVFVVGASGGNAEDALDELNLTDHITLGKPSELSLADRVHGLIASNGLHCALHRSEPETRRNTQSPNDR